MVTGILSVARESIFSRLNNLEVYSILGEAYSDKFGFTEAETYKLVEYYNFQDKFGEFKKWYNGYMFGSATIYNPWSVLSYINKNDMEFMPYWVNTSENKIIKSLLAESNEDVRIGLKELYNGGFVETTINEDLVMADIASGEDNVWSFLHLSGYLKQVGRYKDEESNLFVYKLMIPNVEIKTLYRTKIDRRFKEGALKAIIRIC